MTFMIGSRSKCSILNPYRVRRLMEKTIKGLKLDLTGMTVLTEAASGNYVVTSIMAALANARQVFAVAADSIYGEAKDVEKFTLEFSEFCGVRNQLAILTEKLPEAIGQADVVTNLGFVRPIDVSFVATMKDTAVIPLMCEAWEFRPGDVNLEACRERGIPVMATNEHYPGGDIFSFSGNLCIKMLLEMEIEVRDCKVVIVSTDKFGEVIEEALMAMGSEVYLVRELRTKTSRSFLRKADAVVIADYRSAETFIGSEGHIRAEDFFEMSPGISVVQFAGKVNVKELENLGIPYFPRHEVGSHRMGLTFGDLGPKAVVSLHGAGLKVGEILARNRLKGLSFEATIQESLKNSICQELLASGEGISSVSVG